MTRINVAPPADLTDQHVFAEWRELPRAWGTARKLSPREVVSTFRLGAGHLLFFYDKTGWLACRHAELTEECIGRGIRITIRPPLEPIPGLDGDWTPDAEARAISAARLRARLLEKPPGWYRYGGEPVGHDFYDHLVPK